MVELVKDTALSLKQLAWVTAVAWIQSLAWDFCSAAGKKKKKNKHKGVGQAKSSWKTLNHVRK